MAGLEGLTLHPGARTVLAPLYSISLLSKDQSPDVEELSRRPESSKDSTRLAVP